MSLTSGHGPFSGRRAGVFSAPVPEQVVYVEPYRRRVRAMQGETTVVDSERVVLVHRPGWAPAYGFPAEDVTGVDSHPVAEASGFVTVNWDAVDAWFEEDQPVFFHARNPYHRIDILPTHRRLQVRHGDTVLVDTTETIVLYETSLNPRLYVHQRHVRHDALVPSDTTTYCPYKGTSTYWSAVVGDEVVTDVAFSYEDPLPESAAIAGLVCFEDERIGVTTDLPVPVQLEACG